MNCFKKDYSQYYDLLYKRKNYVKEFLFIKKTIKKYLKKPKSLMDIGCGTGTYSKLMTNLGLDVLGIDISKHMLDIAKKKYKHVKKIKFLKSDICKLKIKKNFDIISALFHILSYQTTPKKINNFFKNSNKHLKEGGILIFDFWYKDGVMNLKSPLKFRKVENKNLSVYRITKSIWHNNLDEIHDNHYLTIFNKKSNKMKTFKEVHKMKYFKIDTIKKYLKSNNFKYLLSYDLSTNRAVNKNSWGALVIAQKI